MSKIKISNNAFPYPMPMVIVGTKNGNIENYMAAAWVSRVNFTPPLIGVAIGKSHLTCRLIHENKEFSISVPETEIIKETDYCGLVSGEKTDKSKIFEAFYGELKNAPMIKNCAVTMECKLTNIMELPTNHFFVGEIINAYAEDAFITNGKPDINKINPFTLSMPDNRYFSVGKFAGNAWKIGIN
ncbi:MAG: flavin reductase family protein [Candidatus Wallbacteria bacterium]